MLFASLSFSDAAARKFRAARTPGRTNERTYGRTDGRTDGQTDKPPRLSFPSGLRVRVILTAKIPCDRRRRGARPTTMSQDRTARFHSADDDRRGESAKTRLFRLMPLYVCYVLTCVRRACLRGAQALSLFSPPSSATFFFLCVRACVHVHVQLPLSGSRPFLPPRLLRPSFSFSRKRALPPTIAVSSIEQMSRGSR